MRRGITPVVAIVLLLMMTVAAAGGAYAWISQVQNEAQEDATDTMSTAVSIEDAQCFRSTVRLALKNQGSTEISGSGTVYVYDDAMQLAGTDGSVDLSATSTPGAVGWTNATIDGIMDPGRTYTVEVETDDGVTTSTPCRTDRWWYQPVNSDLNVDVDSPATLETVSVDQSGWYRISYGAAWDADINTVGRHYMRSWVESDGGTVVPSETICYIRGREESAGDRCSNSATLLVQADEDESFTLRSELYAGGNGETVTAEDTFLSVRRVGQPVAQVRDGTGGQDYSTGPITVNLDAPTRVDDTYTFDAASDAIQVNEAGRYRVHYTITNDDTGQGNRQTVRSWIRLNGNSLPAGHPADAYSYLRNTGSYNHQTANTVLDLASGDSIQLRQDKIFNESSGSSVTVTNMSWLLLEQVPSSDILHVVESGGGQRISSGSTASITFDTTVDAGDSFSHSGAQVTINDGGWYEVAYTFSWDDDGGSGRHGVTGWVEKNGNVKLTPSEQHDYTRGDAQGRRNGIAANTVHRFADGDTITLEVNSEGGYADVIANSTYLTVTPLTR